MEEVEQTLIWVVFQNFSICFKTGKIYSVYINFSSHILVHLVWYILESLEKTFQKMVHGMCAHPHPLTGKPHMSCVYVEDQSTGTFWHGIIQFV